MDILQLKYFQTVARFQHMTRAAEELHIAQPSLSKTISLLEKELGISLFDRRGKYIFLNEYGKIFLEKVDKIFLLLEDSKKELKDLSQKESGNIRLAILSASKFLPDFLSRFNRLHPHISFDLIQHFSSLASNFDFDLCITASKFEPSDKNCISLLKEEIFLAVPSSHPLAEKESIILSEASKENFISLRKGHVLRGITDSLCDLAGFTPNIIFESDDPATLRGLIGAGQGVAFLPEISWGITDGSMKLLHIEKPAASRTIYIKWPDNRYLSSSSKLFLDFIKNYFENLKSELK